MYERDSLGDQRNWIRESDLLALEPIFHRSPPGSEREALAALMAPDFFEVGASGAVYSRDIVLDVVQRRYAEGLDPDDAAWSIDDFVVRRLSSETFLATYGLTFRGRSSRRATLWRHDGAAWTALYHQGTPTTPVP